MLSASYDTEALSSIEGCKDAIIMRQLLKDMMGFNEVMLESFCGNEDTIKALGVATMPFS